MKQNKLKIPASLYVGLLPPSKPIKLPTALMTAYSTDKAGVSRVDNVRRATRNSSRGNSQLGATILENKPLSGFRITGRISHGSSHDFWYIEDPRGFEIEISSTNLSKLMKSGTVDKGEFLFPCIWTRDGSNNVLISTNSQEYISAVSNTAAANGKDSWKNAKIGDTVLLRNNIQGRWMGKMYLLFRHGNSSQNGLLSANEFSGSESSYHIIYVVDPAKNTSCIHIIASPQLSKIVSTDPISKAESEVLVNEYLQDRSCTVHSNLYRKIIAANFGKPGTVRKVFIKELLTPGAEEELSELVGEEYRSTPMVFAEVNGKFGRLHHNRKHKTVSTNMFHIVEYSLLHIDAAELRRVLIESKSTYSSRNLYGENHIPYDFDANDRFYRLQLELTTTEGNKITTYM